MGGTKTGGGVSEATAVGRREGGRVVIGESGEEAGIEGRSLKVLSGRLLGRS